MAIAAGTQLGTYQVHSLLGEGGMGRVFRAHDAKLKRDVAIKVRPDEFSRDPERVARFSREAELLASLNHPNIAAIYDQGDAQGSRYLVLELVEGENLAERIARGPVPCDEALEVAKQIAEALDAAHERGIVHRDLKPANVRVTPDGRVKVLDFGLAKVWADDAARDTTNSPTLTAATMQGVIMGTAGYMSPEQARGKRVDRSADIWAFACVLYEMLTGGKTFGGETVTDVLGAIVRADPDWSALPKDVPPHVRRLLRRCLEKDRRNRLRDASTVLLDLSQSPEDSVAAPTRGAGARWPWIAAIAVLGIALIATTIVALRPEPVAPEMRLDIATVAGATPYDFALSPNGEYVAFAAFGDGVQRLWVRALSTTEARPLAGTEGATFPFWSADSRSLGFFAATKLLRIDVAGGSPQVLATAASGRGGTWNADDTILFTPNTPGPLFRIKASGGEEPVAVTVIEKGGAPSHRFPQFLPDGRHFFFFGQGHPDLLGVYLGSLDGGPPKRLVAADTAAVFLPPNRVVFLRQGTLVTRGIDLAKGDLLDDAVTIADGVGWDANINIGAYSASSAGIAYRAGSAGTVLLTWFDRAGKSVGLAGEPDAHGLVHLDLSPDGRRLAVNRNVQGNPDLYLMDLVRGGFARFTTDGATDQNPVWSPDGARIAFTSNRNSAYDLFVKAASGVSAEELVLQNGNTKIPQDWSKDGRHLLYYELTSATGRDLLALDMTDRKSVPVASTAADETMAEFSPDGHWVAYQTNEARRFEIVVQQFPKASERFNGSTAGGIAPRWRADGRELYFIAPDSKLMAVPVTITGSKFEAGNPVAIVATRIVGGGTQGTNRPQYAVAKDGRFLVNQRAEESTNTPITLVLNWKPPAK